MNKKQDRQGVRTPSDIERKYDLGKNIGEIREVVSVAQRSANEALSSVTNLEKKVNEVEEKIDNVELEAAISHEWQGTTLVITSSSGTSSADLKGEKGDKGDKGADGTVTFEELTAEERQKLLDDLFEMLKNNMRAAKIGYVVLLASAWVGEDSLYSQVVNIEGVTENSQVDLTPSIQQLAVFYEKDLSFVTENEDGVVTVFVIGQKPTNDYTIQVTITEVDV